MKQLKTELRKYISELLLSWAFNIAPSDDEGKSIKTFISAYFMTIKK